MEANPGRSGEAIALLSTSTEVLPPQETIAAVLPSYCDAGLKNAAMATPAAPSTFQLHRSAQRMESRISRSETSTFSSMTF
jgi:hypothetical protein